MLVCISSEMRCKSKKKSVNMQMAGGKGIKVKARRQRCGIKLGRLV